MHQHHPTSREEGKALAIRWTVTNQRKLFCWLCVSLSFSLPPIRRTEPGTCCCGCKFSSSTQLRIVTIDPFLELLPGLAWSEHTAPQVTFTMLGITIG